MWNVSPFVEIVPDAVPVKKNRRFGYVCASTEQKYRWPTGKCFASEYVNGRSVSSQNSIATGPLARTKPSFLPAFQAVWLASQLWEGTLSSWQGEVAAVAYTR